MQIVGIKRVKELTHNDCAVFETVFLVKSGETVEDLVERMGVSGGPDWNYSDFEAILKLVK